MRFVVQGCLRPSPLTPSVVVAEGRTARALLLLLLEEPARLEGLSGVVHQEGEALLLALTADASRLPWRDGVSYFGVDPSAPRLRLCTTRGVCLEGANPAMAAALLEAALCLAHGVESMPMVVLPERIVSLAGAAPLDLDALRALEASITRPAEPHE